VRRAQGFADAAKGEQPGVGIHAFGEPAQQDGQQLPLEGGTPADASRQGFDVPHGTLRIAVAERREPALGGFRGEAGVLTAQLGGRVQQRPVEDPVMELPHRALCLVPRRHERIRVRPVGGERAQDSLGQGAQRVLLHGHQVGPAELEQLDAVFQQPQVAVGVVERGSIRPAYIAAGGQGCDCRGGVATPECFIGLSMHQLQELDREFDVPQPAPAEFDLALLLGGGDMLRHPAAHGLHGFDKAIPARGCPHQG
jgi:hypothetical protein